MAGSPRRSARQYTLVIDGALLDLLKFTPDTPLEVTTDGRALIIAPIADPKRTRRFRRALSKTNRRYGAALRRLAE